MKMASAQDVRFSEGAIEEGRKLANKLWNVARLILQASEGARRPSGRATLEERWILARLSQAQRADRAPARRVRLLARRRRALPPDLRRLLRLVRRGDQAAALRRRRRCACDRARGARAAAQAAPSGDAARHRGDLDAPARAGDAADRGAVARGRRRRRRRRARARAGRGSDRSAAAACCRRARGRGEQRIFDAVVKPEPVSGRTATSRPSARACARRSSAPRRCSRTSASSRNAPAEVVEAEREKLERYRRELDAISD